MNNIIITGSSQGIGAAIAKEWCKRDSNNFYYGISRWGDLDVTNYQLMDETISSYFENHQSKNISLINNAGIVSKGSIFEMTDKQWNDQFNTNINGVFYCSKIFSRECIKKSIGGKIINIASTAGLGARPGRAAYAASKAAVINFSLSLSQELRDYNIKVYCVCPGAVNTNMRKYLEPDDDFKNMMKPEIIGNFVCDLIYNGKYLDGQVLTIKQGGG
jgi:NAD(P)-dependent dehydrogenase (short-subunit alcohol dehydrogenase family)